MAVPTSPKTYLDRQHKKHPIEDLQRLAGRAMMASVALSTSSFLVEQLMVGRLTDEQISRTTAFLETELPES